GGFSGFATVMAGQIVVANPLALSGPSVATSNVVGGIVFSNITSATFGGLGVLGNASTSTAGIGLTNTAGQAVTLSVGSDRGTFTTYSGQLSGSGSFVKIDPTYTLRVQTTNAIYTGDTLINEGTLDVNFGGWFPFGPGAGNLFVGSTAVVGLRTVNSNGTYNVNGLSGSGIIEGFNGAGTKSIVVGNNNATSLFSGSVLNTDPASTFGPLAITKVGTGTFTLTGTNTYTSPTTVNAGVLAIAGDGSISNSASITIGTGALLDFSGQTSGGATLGGGVTNQILRGFGSIKGNLTLGDLASLAPGTNAAPGSLAFSNNLAMSSGVSLSFHAGAATDLAAVGGNLALNGTLSILDGGGITNSTYTLFTYGGTLTTNGSPTILTIGNLPNSNFTYTISITTPHQVNLVVGCPTCTSADPFAAWQSHYFPADGPNAAGSADPDHDGVSNTNEFLAGFNPTNSAAYPHIISVAKINTADINVTYLGANGDNTWSPGIASRTNVLEFTTGTATGGYSNNFASTGQTNILSGGSGFGVVTNMIDSGGATNRPSRYYRVRVLAP
ncbi:MAG TPA: autotransporter-associated beta strand repeat-containing protein, partial [Verrucomicrobiae bacterium]|nr:autotransporter-associated beta strand repeat-containing protein [Verrucomicrobiae bacterium]